MKIWRMDRPKVTYAYKLLQSLNLARGPIGREISLLNDTNKKFDVWTYRNCDFHIKCYKIKIRRVYRSEVKYAYKLSHSENLACGPIGINIYPYKMIQSKNCRVDRTETVICRVDRSDVRYAYKPS